MSFTEFLRSLFTSKPQPATPPSSDHFTGLLPDTRPQAEKDKDYLHEEREPVKATDPFGNQRIDVSPYPYENQQGQSSCVAHGVGLAYAIFRSQQLGSYFRLAWLFNYRRRSNYAGEGMIIPQSFEDYRKVGAPLYATLPDVATEAQANAAVITTQMMNEALIFAGAEYYTIARLKDIQTLASLSEAGTPIAISIFATYQEWAQSYPQVLIPTLTVPDARAVVNHEVCVLPKAGFTEEGRKYIAIQDSAWFGGHKIRYLSEDFVAKRVTTAGYWTKVTAIGTGPRPKFTFTRTLHVGDTGADVKALQTLLIAEGLLPADCATGLFAGRTLAAVRAFQVRYTADILTPQGLTEPTSTFGPGSIKKANALCA